MTTKTERTPKQYETYCITKANGHKYLHYAIISAFTAKDACKTFCREVEIKTGRHAFTPSTGTLCAGVSWNYICERDEVTVSQIKERATNDWGWQFA